jgi:hypothetical protein
VCTTPESDESLTLIAVIYKDIPNIFQTQEIKLQKDNGNGKKHMRRISLSFTAVLSTAVLSHRSLHPPGQPVAAAVLTAPVKETLCINDFCKKQSKELLLQCLL